jgi:hypothetical protein
VNRGLTKSLILLYVLILACNRGLTPPETPSQEISFPVRPEGGNPVGVWLPDTSNTADVALLQEFPVDSIIFDTDVDGIFSFELTGICSVYAIISIRPLIYEGGALLPLNIVIQDTLTGNGSFELIQDEVLYLPVESTIFNFDTLGFTSRQSTLDLITLPTTYVYENLVTLQFYSILHLVRSSANASPCIIQALSFRREEEAWR